MPPLSSYIIHLADNALILGHRNSEWTGHGPILEQDIAISNIALDLIGQSRNFYQLAAKRINEASPERIAITEDGLAYLRNAEEFKNLVLVEQPNGDWGKTLLRQFYFSHFQYLQYQALCGSEDTDLAAIAEKSILETRYHVKWSSEWICRLGDGTTESHGRMLKAMEALEPWVPELFVAADYEKATADNNQGVDPAALKEDWFNAVNPILNTATLPACAEQQALGSVLSGKDGYHSEYLDHILKDMQYLQRTYPGCEW